MKKEQALSLITENAHNFSTLSQKWKSDYTIAETAIKKIPNLYEHIGPSLKENVELALLAVTLDGATLRMMNLGLRNNREVAIAAVKNDGYALDFVGGSLRHDDEISSSAIETSAPAMMFVPLTHPNYKKLLLQAMRKSSFAINHCRDKGLKEMLRKEIDPVHTLSHMIESVYLDEFIKEKEISPPTSVTNKKRM